MKEHIQSSRSILLGHDSVGAEFSHCNHLFSWLISSPGDHSPGSNKPISGIRWYGWRLSCDYGIGKCEVHRRFLQAREPGKAGVAGVPMHLKAEFPLPQKTSVFPLKAEWVGLTLLWRATCFTQSLLIYMSITSLKLLPSNI
jgi:hypothetical protein